MLLNAVSICESSVSISIKVVRREERIVFLLGNHLNDYCFSVCGYLLFAENDEVILRDLLS